MLLGLFLVSQIALACQPTPFPVFLKQGFSSVLEFEETPTQVILGDSGGFQIEKLGKSIIIKPLVPYATTNLFVYFQTKPQRLFILNASEDSEPLFFKRFESLAFSPVSLPGTGGTTPIAHGRSVRLQKAIFSRRKDYLIVDLILSSDSTEKLMPIWQSIQLKYGSYTLRPSKIWSARREIQRDSSIPARLIFHKPNIPRNLANVELRIPTEGKKADLFVNVGDDR